MAAGRERVVAAGIAAWSCGAAFAFAAMLAAARSVIREVRGQCGTAKPKAAKPAKAETGKATPQPVEDEDGDATAFEPAVASDDDSETEYTDGSEQEQRHLSKAERKRLRKLARMNGAA
jgi:flagellar biosynthesis/type III secretory pathway M-ring protein FliF/YscJ